MFGGTNSGKSTVLNILLGGRAAGMSYRARFSQHLVAFRPAAMGDRFLSAFPSRFAGYERYVDQAPPKQEGHDLRTAGYRPTLAVCDPSRLTAHPLAGGVAGEAVFWDIPDFSTEEAVAYMGAVLDTVALADLVLMVVTKENYADHRGTLLRSMIAASGVTIRIVANKMEDGSGLLGDIADRVGGSDQAHPISPTRIHLLPHIAGEGKDDRLARLIKSNEANALRDAVRQDLDTGIAIKQRAQVAAIEFLEQKFPEILKPLNAEVAVAAHWATIVERTTRNEFLDRYRSEYLDGAKYGDFSLTLVKLMTLLEVPKIGPVLSAISGGLRMVSQRLVASVTRVALHAFGRSREAPKRLPEEEVVSTAFERWRGALANEAQVQAQKADHPAWDRIATEMASFPFINQMAARFGASYVEFRDRMDVLITERARSLYEVIERDPRLLFTLRGVKLTIDVGSTAWVVSSGGIDFMDAVIGPLVATVQRLILEYGLERFVDSQKDKLKQEQFEMFRVIIQKDMVAPVLDLFRGEVHPEDLAQARADFAEVKAVALAVAGVEGATR